MTFSLFYWPAFILSSTRRLITWRKVAQLLVLLLATLSCFAVITPSAAFAGLTDDRYDGDIFALYAGNGSLVPPKVTLEEALKRDRPALLVLYIDDSRDSKEYAPVVSQVQAFYGRVIDILPIRADSIPVKDKYAPTEPGYYYQGVVPQTVVFDASGKVLLNEAGVIPYEKIDDQFRKVFDLLPRSESAELKRRQVNEFTTELSK